MRLAPIFATTRCKRFRSGARAFVFLVSLGSLPGGPGPTTLAAQEMAPAVGFTPSELFGYWKLDGDFSDALKSHDGTYVEESGGPAEFVTGADGRALDLTDGAGFVELGLEVGPGPKSISFFARTPDFEPELVWVGNRSPGVRGDYDHRFYLGSFTEQLFWGGGRNHRRGGVWPDLSPDRFHHYALVQRSGTEAGGSLEIYQNGALLQTVNYDGSTGSHAERLMRIGRGGGQLTHPCVSVVDDVAIFKRALSAAEVRAIATTGSVGALLASTPPVRPNVVVLLSDDLGYRDLGCYDGPVRTPVLDQLAADGMRFTDFYAGAAVCSPSRATLLTGRHHIRAGIYSWVHDQSQESHLLNREITLAEILRDAGYATAHVGKWHLGWSTPERAKPTPADHGFDHWFATANNAKPSHRDPVNFVRNSRPVGRLTGYAAQLVVDEAIAWLRQPRPAGQPFFLNVWFQEPHHPLAAPPELTAHYGEPTEEGAVYSATVENTDRAIGRLIQTLRSIAPAEETLIIYASDNGSYRRDRVGELRGVKGTNWEGGLRVPGIVSWPGTVPAGRVESTPAGVVDVLPTVCGLLGLPSPTGVHLDGADISPVLRGSAETFVRPQPMVWHLHKSRPIVALRDGRWSFVADPDREISRRNLFEEAWIPDIKASGYANFQLFDLEADPGQSEDVAARHPAVVARLRAALLRINDSIMREGPDYGASPNS
ncbi:sulfatase-like hydrolase/transferase [Synoicihabitans lomoniglobus]|uniref:Sulfatase-like hydrolase/transferase n=1 Tax=Synoicihabitans lomoniglobus TaxID=2909285 RepID=A0AAF0CQ17_9BACT|nr:sulfatase-like hydrolase/transferase [Opitutaceae bacterium LMO-M01]WED65960.1 sulfatase-like hydrolase/transferase [Opitutaceae bacterium LMO-M01]